MPVKTQFIARRIIIHAAEDVGLADPMALVLANAAFHAAEFIGWPEARIPIAEAAIYIACANKSNSVVKAIDSALGDVRSGKTLPVPDHLKDSLLWSEAAGMGQDTSTHMISPATSCPRITLGLISVFTNRLSRVWKENQGGVDYWREHFAKIDRSQVKQPQSSE